MIYLIFLTLTLILILFGYFTSKLEGEGQGDPFYVFAFYSFIVTIVLFNNL